jgi:osmotically-inducible protein OsmY
VVTPATANLEVDVVAHNGGISVRGKLSNRDQIKEVESVVRKVPGVTGVDLDLFTDVSV